MQPILQKSTSDDEDDLESLRLAALQSLKRPTTSIATVGNSTNLLKLFSAKSNKRRFNPGRTNRNGVFNNRIRNTTLITVPTVELDNATKDVGKKADTAPKLVLPQDRYCNTSSIAEEKSEASSKFDRYNNSDSDTDSDSNDESSALSKLTRSDSLEALMQELENEIHGDLKSKDDVEQRLKKNRKVRKSKEEVDVVQDALPNKVEEQSEEAIKEEPIKIVVKSPPKQLHKKRKIDSCVSQNIPTSNLMYTNTQVPFQAMPYVNYNASLCPPIPFEVQLPYNYPVAPPLICVNDLNPPPQPVFVKYDNPPPPLNINTDILNTISAPLSPRSAAFVLQNREIIERRKKSPRRSYSRSPSPRYRRSNSRSVSPVRRQSPKNRRPQNYKRSSPTAIIRYNQTSPKRTRKSPLRSVRALSEEKMNKPIEKSPSLSLSPSPERFITEESKDNNSLDPVLEARRKKFQNGTVPTEGVIRLRPKNDGNEDGVVSSTKDDTGELEVNSIDEESDGDELLAADDTIDFTLKVDDLFSDDESDSENEGRFKLKQNSPQVVPIKPFAQIGNGINRALTTESDKRQNNREKSYRSKPYDREKRCDRDRRESKRSSRSPPVKLPRNEKDQEGIKSLMSLKIDNPKKKTPVETKSEVRTKHVDEGNDESNVKEKKGSSVRKVEVANVEECVVQEDSDADDDLTNANSEGSGDLRAQLSRKRAERQHMLPKTEKIASRLLQNALQGAVFKKPKKSKKKDKDLTSIDNVDDIKYAAVRSTTIKNGYGVAGINYYTANAERKVRLLHCDSGLIPTASDGKLPIHLRLGIPGSFNVVNESKVQKKSSGKRSKSRAKYEQV